MLVKAGGSHGGSSSSSALRQASCRSLFVSAPGSMMCTCSPREKCTNLHCSSAVVSVMLLIAQKKTHPNLSNLPPSSSSSSSSSSSHSEHPVKQRNLKGEAQDLKEEGGAWGNRIIPCVMIQHFDRADEEGEERGEGRESEEGGGGEGRPQKCQTVRGIIRNEEGKVVGKQKCGFMVHNHLQISRKQEVSSAINEKTTEKVAIKKLHRPFQSEIFAKRAYRELRLLKHMKHENVIGILDVFTPASSLSDFQDFYLVMPYMFTDLSKVRGNLSEDKVQFLVYQMLCGLRYIHKAGIIHRDLKPGNLAVNQDCELKILDFGLARSTDAEMTGYVVTRWYRAPEVILNWMHYTQTGKTIVAVTYSSCTPVLAVVSPALMDIWSVGCIMAEMINGKTLFKGKDYMDQLTQIMKVTGVPGPEFIQKLDSPEAKNYVKALPRYPRKDFSTLFTRASAQDYRKKKSAVIHVLIKDEDPEVGSSYKLLGVFMDNRLDWKENTIVIFTKVQSTSPGCFFRDGIDLLEKMLVLDGDERPTAELALEHPYFDSLRDPDDFREPEMYDDSHDNATLSLDEWKRLCFKELKDFVPFPRRDSKRKNTLTIMCNLKINGVGEDTSLIYFAYLQ
ncbi:hypothetical protein INR49_022169 [Caranx melampygus]|nr:hypothetical protein INR49_022169 [Caranx melampygus]